MIDYFADFRLNFSERALLVLKNSITVSITIFCTVEHPFKRTTTEIWSLWAISAHHYLAESDNKLTT